MRDPEPSSAAAPPIEDSSTAEPLTSTSVKCDDFVVVKYAVPLPDTSKKRNSGKKCNFRLYVERIKSVFVNKVYIDFMRPVRNSKCVFSFPHVKDYDYVKFTDLVRRLPAPTEEGRANHSSPTKETKNTGQFVFSSPPF